MCPLLDKPSTHFKTPNRHSRFTVKFGLAVAVRWSQNKFHGCHQINIHFRHSVELSIDSGSEKSIAGFCIQFDVHTCVYTVKMYIIPWRLSCLFDHHHLILCLHWLSCIWMISWHYQRHGSGLGIFQTCTFWQSDFSYHKPYMFSQMQDTAYIDGLNRNTCSP